MDEIRVDENVVEVAENVVETSSKIDWKAIADMGIKGVGLITIGYVGSKLVKKYIVNPLMAKYYLAKDEPVDTLVKELLNDDSYIEEID